MLKFKLTWHETQIDPIWRMAMHPIASVQTPVTSTKLELPQTHLLLLIGDRTKLGAHVKQVVKLQVSHDLNNCEH